MSAAPNIVLIGTGFSSTKCATRPASSGCRMAGYRRKSNADQVRKIREIVENLGLTIATPEEARERLALKGGDRVSF